MVKRPATPPSPAIFRVTFYSPVSEIQHTAITKWPENLINWSLMTPGERVEITKVDGE